MNAQQVREYLREVMDPEIPTISLVDLGVINTIEIHDDGLIEVGMIPTFSGCPALRVMEDLVKEKLIAHGAKEVHVKTTFDVAWSTDLITEHGREMLLKHGLAPPPKNAKYMELDVLSDVACPQCSSHNTEMRSPFGPTLCRSLHYCKNCKQGFEQFKPLG